MARVCTTGLSRLACVGFIAVLCVAPTLCDPLRADATSSVATPLGFSQLVAAASDRDQGLGPTPKASDNKTGSEGVSGVSQPPPASEVGDLMRDPYHNITLSITDRDEEAMINNETDIIYDPHVNRLNKTHEEEGAESSSEAPLDRSTIYDSHINHADSSSEAPLDSSTPQPSVQDSSRTPATERSTNNAQVTEGSVSLAEVSSLPASALVSQHEGHDHSAISKTASLNHTTQAAAILAGVLVLIAIIGYLGLLLWRRVLEKRYGNREMLVNEDDDFKHFEL